MYTVNSILRSNIGNKYLLYVYESINKAMNIKARDSESIKKVIVLSSITNSYVEGTASSIDVCGQTVRNNLKEQDPERVLKYNEEILKKMREMGALKKPVIVAMDWHDIMFYGDVNAEGVKGTKHKNGTNWAYQFATAAVVIGDEKLTVAVTPVNNESRVEHVRRLLSKVFELGIKMKILLLDAGYYTVDIINYLNANGINFIMRAKGEFKEGDDLIYETNSKRKRPDEQATVRIVAVKDRNELSVFATNTHLKPKAIRRIFRKRWAIETSYRMINQFLPKTTSKLYSLRKLYFYLAVLLYNIWVFMNYKREKVTVQYVKFLLMIEALISNVYVTIFR